MAGIIIIVSDPLKMTCSTSCGFIAHLVRALHWYHRVIVLLKVLLMDPLKMTCSTRCGFIAQLVRALHWYRRKL